MENDLTIELEIQRSLLSEPSSALVVEALEKKYPWVNLNLPELRSLSLFFLGLGQYPKLISGICQRLKAEKEIHWDIFCEALFKSSAVISRQLKQALIDGAEAQSAFNQLLRIPHLDYFDERILKLRANRGEELKTRLKNLRSQLFEEIEVLRSQGLLDQQLTRVQQLKKYFPDDSEAKKLEAELSEQKKLLRISQKPITRASSRPYIPIEKPDPLISAVIENIELSMDLWLQSNPELANDFSIGQLMWENHNSALRLLEKSEQSIATGWLKAHLLLSTRRFVELIDYLPQIQSLDINNPDATFEAIYFQAQALWGLGYNISAIEMLESLLLQRPNYRTASTLLSQWRAESE